MLDIRFLRENAEQVQERLSQKGCDLSVAGVLEADVLRRGIITELEQLQKRRNDGSKQIGALKKAGDEEAAQAQMAAVKVIGEQVRVLEERQRVADGEVLDLLLALPNLAHVSVPVGADESANRHDRTEGVAVSFDFDPKPHWVLGEGLGILDFPRSARMAGAGWPMLVGEGARLSRALISLMLDMHTREHGYTEVEPPLLVNTDAMVGTGQLPKMTEDMYRVAEEDLWLIPTAEVPVTNMYREEIIDEGLPLYRTAYTPCFRREAGKAGKMTRGLNRLHQFNKVEMVKFVEPSRSYDELEGLLGNAEAVLKRLGLHYRVLTLCSGDTSFASAKTYDLELWAPGQEAWLEVSSVSNFEDFQARRAGIRFRDGEGKVQFVHTLNGSGVALPRLIVALMENGQQADGSIELPEALHSYMGGVTRLEAAKV